MSVAIVVPWRPMGEDRIALWARLRPWWEEFGWPIVEADSGDEPFNRGRSQNEGARSLDWDVLLVLDADVLVPREQVRQGVNLATETDGIVLPHSLYVPLNAEETATWLASDDLEQYPEPSRVHNGGAVGGLHIISRAAGDRIAYDGETRHRGQDRRLLLTAARRGIEVSRIEGPLVHGHHDRPDVDGGDLRRRILEIDPTALPNTARWVRIARELRRDGYR